MKAKYALVTGGSRGIGSAICAQLSLMGYTVIINYKSNEEAAKNTAQIIADGGGIAQLLPFDVADRNGGKLAVKNWQNAHPNAVIEVLVNNAGIRDDALLPMMGDEQWDSVINTNLNGMYNITRELITPMAMHRHGRIVNIVSLSGLKGMPGQVNYSAAKAGIVGATKALAQEVAKRNITVNAVAPGFIKTDMTNSINQPELIKMIPANRFGEPHEVAALVGFLVSDAAAYITGQVISVNGGLY